jgi:L-fuculose-phosphate aldolase
MEGHTDMTQGHLTIRDPAGRGFWIKRTGIAFSKSRFERFCIGRSPGKRMAGIGGVW